MSHFVLFARGPNLPFNLHSLNHLHHSNTSLYLTHFVLSPIHAEDFSTLYQHQMGSIRLRRTEVSFSPEGRAVERIPFVNLSGKPLKLEADSAMLPDCLEVSTEPAVLEDRQEGSLIITFDPSRGNVRPRMNVILKGLGVAPSRSLILVKIEN